MSELYVILRIMSVLTIIRDIISPELNHIYTSPPFPLSDGAVDAGWFCREHALHIFVLSRLLGFDSDIRTGNFISKNSIGEIMHSMINNEGHAWCMVDGCIPVDASMNFRFHERFQDIKLPVIGVGMNDPYIVQYVTESKPISDQAVMPTIVFLESHVMPHSPIDLINDPYCFLHQPDQNNPLNWDSQFGSDIYNSITLHCFRLAIGDANTIVSKISTSNAPMFLNKEYPNAAEELKSILNQTKKV